MDCIVIDEHHCTASFIHMCALNCLQLRYITKLRDFLLDSRKDYINMRHLTSDACSMTDYERDKIDTEAEAVIHQCNTLIKDLNNEGKTKFIAPDEHSLVTAVIVNGCSEESPIYLQTTCSTPRSYFGLDQVISKRHQVYSLLFKIKKSL